MPEVQVVFPAGVKELPLEVGHFDELCAFLLLHSRIVERNEEGRDERALGIAQIVKKIKRLSGVFIGFSRQSDDESAEREPVVLVEDFHSLKHHVAPLMGFIRISFALHENIEKARAARFQADNRIRHALLRIGRLFMLHVRVGNNQRGEPFDDGRILDHGRHCDMGHLQRFNSRDALDTF